MQTYEVKNSLAGFAANGGNLTSRQSKSSVVSEYSAILAEKLANVKADLEEMNTVREQLEEIRELHEELTGQIKVDEDSGNANRESSNANSAGASETIKRFMPDGSIMITTYRDGSVVQQVKQRPHLIPVPDYSAPPTASGETPVKMEARQSLDLLSLLM